MYEIDVVCYFSVLNLCQFYLCPNCSHIHQVKGCWTELIHQVTHTTEIKTSSHIHLSHSSNIELKIVHTSRYWTKLIHQVTHTTETNSYDDRGSPPNQHHFLQPIPYLQHLQLIHHHLNH
jgi:hypothetical protein